MLGKRVLFDESEGARTSRTGDELPPPGLVSFSSLMTALTGELGERITGDLSRPALPRGLVDRLLRDLDLLSRSLDLERLGLLDLRGLRVRERVRDLRYLFVGGERRLLSSYLFLPERPLSLDLDRRLSLLLDLERDLDLPLPIGLGDLLLPLGGRSSLLRISMSCFLVLCEEDTSSFRVITEDRGMGGATSGGGGGGAGAEAAGGGGGGVGSPFVAAAVPFSATTGEAVVESGE